MKNLIFLLILSLFFNKSFTQNCTVNAGVDVTVCPGNNVILEGNIGGNYIANSLVWTQVSGPNTATFSSTTSLSPTISGLITGTYIFRITATCQIGGNAIDNVNVIVSDGAIGVAPSLINVGCYTPGSTINLTGTAPAGHTLTWSVASNTAPTAGTFNGTALTTVTGDNPTLQFAAPNAAWCSPSSVAYINVVSTNNISNCNVSNSFPIYMIFSPPAITASADPNIVCGTCVNLIGSCVQDGVGLWTIVSSPTGAPAVNFLPNNTSSVTKVCNLIPGNYTFQWTVSGATCTNGNSIVNITVNPSVTITPPNATGKRFCPGSLPSIVSLEGNLPNNGETVLWTQVSGPTVTINNPTSPYAQAIGLTAAGTPYIFNYTIFNGGCSASDTMMISITKTLGYQPINYGACGSPTPSFISHAIGSIPFDHSDSVSVSIIYESGPANNLQLLFWADMQTQGGSPTGISYFSPNYNINNGGTGTHVFQASTLWPTYNQYNANIYFWFYTNNNIPSCNYLLPGLYRFRVQYKDHCGTYTSNPFEITVSSTGSFNAGSEQMLGCGTITTTLAANTQSCEMVPYWTTVSKPSGAPDPISALNMFNTNAAISGLQSGTYIFQWGSSSSGWGCPVRSDSVRVTVSVTPPAPPIVTGGDTFCVSTPVAVSGALNTDALNGTWSVTTSPLGGAFTISPNINAPNIIFTPTTPNTIYTLRWTVVNGCGSNFGTTDIVTGSDTAQIPDITNVNNCFAFHNLGFGTLSATPAGGTWTSSNANYTLTTPNAVSTTVSPFSFSTSLGNVVFYYTVTGACGTIRDSVSYGVFQIPTLPNGSFCNITSFPTAQALTLTGLLPYSNYIINGISGPGTATITPMSFTPTGTTQNITLNASQAGQYSINILQVAGTCTQTTSYTVQLSEPPPLALAGPDVNICGTTNFVNLNALPNPLGSSGGNWSVQTVYNGFAPTFSNAASPTSTATFNNGGGDVLLKWSVTGSNANCPSTNADYLRVRYVPTANAGADDFTCYNAAGAPAAIVLNGNNHTAGVGLWTIVSQPSGSNAIFINPNLPNTTISNLINGVYVLRWTITDPGANCPVTFDDVNILVYVGCSVLPLDLSTITANWENRNGKIFWKIENDDYRNKYSIERAMSLQGMFSQIGTLDYNPNANGAYTFFDRNAADLATKFIYYRIKTLDANNEVRYSKIVMIRTSKEDQISVFPTLIKRGEKIKVQFNTTTDQSYNYKMVNMMGSTIVEKINSNGNLFTIGTDKLIRGAYILQFYNAKQTFVYKIVVQ